MTTILIITNGLIGLLGWLTQKDLRRRWKIVAVLLLLVCGGFQFLIERERAHELAKSKWVGVLSSSSMSFEGQKSKKKIEFGWSLKEPGHTVEYEGNFLDLFKNARPRNRHFLAVFEDLSITIAEDRGQLEVSMLIRDDKGSMVASLHQNQWKVSQPPLNYDRNYTDDMLEVVDDKGNVRLQLRLLGDKVQMNGVFYGPSGYGMEIYPVVGEEVLANYRMLGPGVKPSGKIQPIFKYPSELNLGELKTSLVSRPGLWSKISGFLSRMTKYLTKK